MSFSEVCQFLGFLYFSPVLCHPARRSAAPAAWVPLPDLLFPPSSSPTAQWMSGPELCFDVFLKPTIGHSQNRHLSILMHQGTPPPASLLPSPGFNSAAALTNINPAPRVRVAALQVVSHVITIIYKTHSGSLAQ